MIPSEVEGSFLVLFPAPWGDIKRKSFVANSSACGEVVHSDLPVVSKIFTFKRWFFFKVILNLDGFMNAKPVRFSNTEQLGLQFSQTQVAEV